MWGKGILILDDSRFSRVCSAILGLEGYDAETLPEGKLIPDTRGHGLVITSYPFSAGVLPRLLAATEKSDVPFIVLTGSISDELVWMLDRLNNVHCMLMPLDYRKFRDLVKKVMTGQSRPEGGYKIV